MAILTKALRKVGCFLLFFCGKNFSCDSYFEAVKYVYQIHLKRMYDIYFFLLYIYIYIFHISSTCLFQENSLFEDVLPIET